MTDRQAAPSSRSLAFCLPALFLLACESSPAEPVHEGAGPSNAAMQWLIESAPVEPRTSLQTVRGTGSECSTVADCYAHYAVQFTVEAAARIHAIEVWMGPRQRGALAVVLRRDENNLPGRVVESRAYAPDLLPEDEFGWVSFPDRAAVLTPGIYWVTLEPVEDGGFVARLPTGTDNPARNAWRSHLTVEWVELPNRFSFGLRLGGSGRLSTEPPTRPMPQPLFERIVCLNQPPPAGYVRTDLTISASCLFPSGVFATRNAYLITSYVDWPFDTMTICNFETIPAGWEAAPWHENHSRPCMAQILFAPGSWSGGYKYMRRVQQP